MKHIILLLAIVALISCKPKQGIAKEFRSKESFLWTIILSNGPQEDAIKMTQTRYIFLTNSDDKDSLCNGSSLISETAYKEFSRNDHTIEKPVWSTRDKNVTTLKARQILDIACGNEDATFGRGSVTKFPMTISQYSEFQEALK